MTHFEALALYIFEPTFIAFFILEDLVNFIIEIFISYHSNSVIVYFLTHCDQKHKDQWSYVSKHKTDFQKIYKLRKSYE
jgi:hypothetical protein